MAYGKEGLQVLADGVNGPLRLNKDGALVSVQAGGKYMEATREGRVFVAANQAAAALTAAFATTYTGLVLSNPPSSPVNLVLLRAGFALSVVASAQTTIGLMTGCNPTTPIAVSIVPRNRLVGGVGSQARVSASTDFTGGVPVLEQLLAQVGTGATTVFGIGSPSEYDIDGSLILQPGCYVAFYSTAAFTAAFLGSFMWEEVPR